MSYTVQQLARLANVSVRTLHYYDALGLLQPARIQRNGYRQYSEAELLRLQQILFFRELDFPLADIQRILSSPNFDMRQALRDQRRMITLKQQRLKRLIRTIDKTIRKINHKVSMTDQQLYTDFSTEEMDQYAAEAKQRWGHTEAYKQSMERVKRMSKADMALIKKKGDELMKAMVAQMPEGPKSPAVQALILQHYNNLGDFYEPTFAMYRGLAEMYISDARFTAYYEKYAKGLAQFMHDAMVYFIDTQQKK